MPGTGAPSVYSRARQTETQPFLQAEYGQSHPGRPSTHPGEVFARVDELTGSPRLNSEMPIATPAIAMPLRERSGHHRRQRVGIWALHDHD